MLTTLVMLAALGTAPGHADELTLSNVRATYGILGPKRTDSKVLPGDSLFFSFDMEGITADKDGKVLYSMAIEITDGNGKPIVRKESGDLEAINALGGTSIPAMAHIDIGLDDPAGDYMLKVTVTDRASKKSKTLEGKFQILPKAFGLIRLHLSSDVEGMAPAGLLGTGQPLWINAAVIGFSRETAQKQPNVAVELRALDENEKPTMAKPFTGSINKDVQANAVALPVQFLLPLNRAGKFTIELKATDQVTGKSVTQRFPITVQASK